VYSSWIERPKNKDTKNNKASLFYITFGDLNKAFSVIGKSRKVKHHWLRKVRKVMSDGMEGRNNIDFYSASLWSKVLGSSKGIVLISARKMGSFFGRFFFFALKKYTDLKIKFSASPWIPVHINPYIWPLVFANLVETTHPKCLTHLLCASLFSASCIFFFCSEVSANATAFSFCYSDLSSILLSNSSILSAYFITQLANNFYILKYVILLPNMFDKCF
jgi:hypothetical protein